MPAVGNLMLPVTSKLDCTFDMLLVDTIRNGAIALRQTELPKKQLEINYSKLLSAGYHEPLLAINHVNSFVEVQLSDVAQIASGENSILALSKHGNVYGRGRNEYGELAFGDKNERKSWTQIEGFSCNVQQIAYSTNHSLFLTADGQVFSCGHNGMGQLVCECACNTW